MTTEDQSYEMLWDCSFCGQKKLLAVTHKFCPGCGGAQDAAHRYFPKEGEEVALADHKFAGADKVCPNCKALSGAAASNCAKCGAGLSGSKEAVRHEDDGKDVEQRKRDKHAALKPPPMPGNAPAAAKKSGLPGWVYAVGGILVALGLFYAFYEKKAEIVVTAHSWARVVELERLTEVREKSECSSVPGAGRVQRRWDDSRSRQVPDGKDCHQECSTKRNDKGDGSFGKSKSCHDVCTTKYRTEHYLVRMCDYDIDKWVTGREIKAGGQDKAPRWPEVSLAAGASPRNLGAERERKRTGDYVLHFKSGDKTYDCNMDDEGPWAGYEDGSKLTLGFDMFGKPNCKQLVKPKA